ncbi:MAG: RNase III inhibitor [Candidatus Omnitrophica bacterium 4484_171]|nr:MAG: RNase III inhibitor [Candidatus Omnitrophica bacterium 4484_171]
MEIEKGSVRLECLEGDITRQGDIDAVVNAANAYLRSGGGVAGAIHRAAGPELEKVCRPLSPIKPGEAVITPAFNLPNRYVIHCLGPVYGVDKPEGGILFRCYSNALKLAEKHRISSVAFPAISTGIFGFPMEKAARVAFAAILSMVPELLSVTSIRFVLYNKESLEVHESVLAEMANS